MLDKACDGSASNWNVFNAGTYDIALSYWYNMGDTIPRVDDNTSESPLPHLPPSPAGSQGEHSLDCYVEPWHVETLEHDLCCVFSVLGGVERWLS